VRVACPARGTLLASKRLDAYLSVFKWSLELAGIAVVPAIVDFLAAVATRREDPAKIPGLSAQIPDNPLFKWLYAATDPIPGDLRVVAGDIEGDSVLSWLKTLVADSFYWTDNDLVVQTRSMYGGVPRDNQATFVLDQGGKVSHFKYFSNEESASAIMNALVDGDTRKFRPIGPKSWAGDDSSGARAAPARAAPAAADKPAVFVLPGHSRQQSRGRRPTDLVGTADRLRPEEAGVRTRQGQGHAGRPARPLRRLVPVSRRNARGRRIRLRLARSARRRSSPARRCRAGGARAREGNGLPVRIVAHSMGGLLARTMLLERPQVWKAMMSREGARVLMLGTPNGGSWAPMQVLSGDDSFGNLLVTIGAPFSGHEARTLMAAFPGFIQLQASLLEPSLGLASAATWKKLAADDLAAAREQSVWHNLPLQLDVYEWGVPTQDALDQAVALRNRLDAQRDTALASYADRMLLVVGNPSSRRMATMPEEPKGWSISTPSRAATGASRGRAHGCPA
jgi:hypothetical protein